MGAWIETTSATDTGIPIKSHPTWVRGLKLCRPQLLYSIFASHPTWVRGLKHVEHPHKLEEQKVAPYMGAWIETIKLRVPSLPIYVAPYMGAWIETIFANQWSGTCNVAPYMGAWIETCCC